MQRVQSPEKEDTENTILHCQKCDYNGGRK